MCLEIHWVMASSDLQAHPWEIKHASALISLFYVLPLTPPVFIHTSTSAGDQFQIKNDCFRKSMRQGVHQAYFLVLSSECGYPHIHANRNVAFRLAITQEHASKHTENMGLQTLGCLVLLQASILVFSSRQPRTWCVCSFPEVGSLFSLEALWDSSHHRPFPELHCWDSLTPK